MVALLRSGYGLGVQRAQFCKARMRAMKCAGKRRPSNVRKKFGHCDGDYLLEKIDEKIFARRGSNPGGLAASPHSLGDDSLNAFVMRVLVAGIDILKHSTKQRRRWPEQVRP
jgi:hypothetical protein